MRMNNNKADYDGKNVEQKVLKSMRPKTHGRWKWILGIVAAVLCLGILCMIFSPISELRKNSIKDRQVAILRENMEAYTNLARELLAAGSEDEPVSYYQFRRMEEQNGDLCRKIQTLSDETGAELSCAAVYQEDSVNNYAGDCVFTYELRRLRSCSQEIYCWVDMVYNENMTELLQREYMQAAVSAGVVIPVNEYWCIKIRYGY